MNAGDYVERFLKLVADGEIEPKEFPDVRVVVLRPNGSTRQMSLARWRREQPSVHGLIIDPNATTTDAQLDAAVAIVERQRAQRN